MWGIKNSKRGQFSCRDGLRSVISEDQGIQFLSYMMYSLTCCKVLIVSAQSCIPEINQNILHMWGEKSKKKMCLGFFFFHASLALGEESDTSWQNIPELCKIWSCCGFKSGPWQGFHTCEVAGNFSAFSVCWHLSRE